MSTPPNTPPVSPDSLSPEHQAGGGRPFRPLREAGCLITIFLGVVFSRGAFVWFESLHFDSDQAVVGLMAWDLARGEGFTVYYYGLGYLATIEPYLAVPWFALFGPSRWALKFPLLLMAIAVAIMMYVAFRRDAGASPRLALLLVAPFAVPSVVMASRLVEANGGNLDVFFWLMVLWFLRRRPVWLGLAAGLALQCRLFCAYGVLSLLVILLCKRQWKGKDYAVCALGGTAMYFLIELLAGYALNNFGVGAPVRLSSFGEALRLFQATCTQLIPPLFGFVPTELAYFNITSDLVTYSGPLALVTVLSVALLFAAGAGLLRYRSGPHWGFPCYLMGCGLLSVLAFCALQGNLRVDRMQIRYLLVVLLLPMGLAGLVCQMRWRLLAVVALLAWGAVNLTQGAALWADLARKPPPDPYADLAEAFRRTDYSVAVADYGTCYYVTFLLAEDKIVASTKTPRSRRYQEVFKEETGPGRAAILDRPVSCPNAVRVHHWTICPVPPDFR